MGANSHCYLPNDVRARDIVTTIAYLCGAERVRTEMKHGGFYAGTQSNQVGYSPGNSLRSNQVYVLATHDMQYHSIEIAPTTCDDVGHSLSLFTYPDANHKGHILLYGGVSYFCKAVMRGLVDMFGGYVDDDDCDSSDADYRKRKPRKVNCPVDGDEWNAFQQDLLDLPQLFEFVD